MRNKAWFLGAFVSLLLIYSILNGRDKTNDDNVYIIISYSLSSNEINVYRGGLETESIKCKKRDVNNCVVELLTQYSAGGYELVSTTSSPTSSITSIRDGYPGIYAFLKKVK